LPPIHPQTFQAESTTGQLSVSIRTESTHSRTVHVLSARPVVKPDGSGRLARLRGCASAIEGTPSFLDHMIYTESAQMSNMSTKRVTIPWCIERMKAPRGCVPKEAG
jgi:hypothetical protein